MFFVWVEAHHVSEVRILLFPSSWQKNESQKGSEKKMETKSEKNAMELGNYSLEAEQKVREFWEKNDIPKKAREHNKNGKTFFMMDGPPYA